MRNSFIEISNSIRSRRKGDIQGAFGIVNGNKNKHDEIIWNKTVKGCWKEHFRDLYGNDGEVLKGRMCSVLCWEWIKRMTKKMRISNVFLQSFITSDHSYGLLSLLSFVMLFICFHKNTWIALFLKHIFQINKLLFKAYTHLDYSFMGLQMTLLLFL